MKRLQVLQSLQEKPWYLQAAAFGAVGLLLFGLFWHFVDGPTRAETAEMQAKIDALLAENARAQAAEQRLQDFRGSYARVQSEYEDLKALLPERRELTMVLHNLQERARGRLSVVRFTPKDEVQQDFYTGKPVEVMVAGSYNNLGQFFAQMASYQRIVSITDFKITRLKEDEKGKDEASRTVEAQFLLTAYYAPPEKLNAVPAPEEPKKGKGKKGKEKEDKKKEEAKKEAA